MSTKEQPSLTAQELADKIIVIVDEAHFEINRSTESDWPGIFSSVMEDIKSLCEKQLKGGQQ